jgi:hypothetical protein
MADLEELGRLFAKLLAERGYNIDDHTSVMNGLGAYYILDLKGTYPSLDKEVEKAINTAYDMAMKTINKSKLH